ACLMNERAREALAAARLPQAERLARRAVAVMAREVGEGHPDHVAALLTLASALEMCGDLAAAEAAVRRAVAAMEAIAVDHPAVHLLLVQSLIGLGNLLRAMGRYTEARSVLERALRESEVRIGPETEQTARALNALGMLCKYDGSFDEGETAYGRALSILERAHGPEHLDVATILHNLGGLAHARGDCAAGEAPARRAYEMWLAAAGPDHPRVAAEGVALAAILDGLGRFAESRSLYERALEVVRRTYGEEHDEIAVTLNNLAG